jgi:tRNA threonylcarbamoyladenosine biosynthesis protein TsaB
MLLVGEALEKSKKSLNDISSYAFVAGPGSFTGIRTGLAYVKGLAFGSSMNVIPISSLEILAGTVKASEWDTVIALIDARLNALYVAIFDRSGLRKMDDSVIEPSKLASLVSGKTVIVGHDAPNFKEYANDAVIICPDKEVTIQATARIVAAKSVVAENYIKITELTPAYLRASYAELALKKIL